MNGAANSKGYRSTRVYSHFALLNKNISNGQVKFSTKNMNAKIIVCELSVKMVVTFVVVLYRNQ